MPAPSHPNLQIECSWDRPIVPIEGGAAILVTQIVASAQVIGASIRPPLDIAFVLDRSGSMEGEPLELVKQAIGIALNYLDERDRVSLVTFDDEVTVWQELSPATARLKTVMRLQLAAIEVGGSTNLGEAWMTGCEQHGPVSHNTSPRVRRTILLTDGQANVGITDPATLGRFASQYRERGVGTTTIGVGLHFDEMLLSAMAEAGGGNFVFVEHPSTLPAFFARETGDLANIVAMSPRLILTLQPGVTGRLLNIFPARVDGQHLTIDLRDLTTGDTLALIMELTIPPGPENSVIALSARLQLADGLELPISIPGLCRRPARDVAAHPANPEVLRRHALERSAAARREAIRRDRAGDIAGSRLVLRESLDLLMSAPGSDEITAVATDISDLAQERAAFSESTRKRVIQEGHTYSRGNRRG